MIRWWGKGRDGKSLKKFWILNPIILKFNQKKLQKFKISFQKAQITSKSFFKKESKLSIPASFSISFYNSKAASISQDFFFYIIFDIIFYILQNLQVNISYVLKPYDSFDFITFWEFIGFLSTLECVSLNYPKNKKRQRIFSTLFSPLNNNFHGIV